MDKEGRIRTTETIAIINQKGGVAKTTTAHNVGAGLAMKGYKVLFLDLDQGRNLSYALDILDIGATKESDTGQLFKGEKVKNLVINSSHGWDAIPGSGSLASIEKDEDGNPVIIPPDTLKKALGAVAGTYDYVIMDTPPGLGVITVNALTAADKIIIPAQAAPFSLQGIGELSQTLDAIRQTSNPSLTVEGILLTLYKERSNLSRAMATMLEQTAELLKTKVFRSKIRFYQAHGEAQACQESIFEYAPTSNAAADYADFIREYLEG